MDWRTLIAATTIAAGTIAATTIAATASAATASAVATASASQPIPQPFPWSRRGAILDRAIPAVGSTANRPPREIRLRFDRGVIASLSRVQVETPTGAAVVVDRPVNDPADPRVVLVRPRRALPAGTYTVRWDVVSVDRHQAAGAYRFSVARAGSIPAEPLDARRGRKPPRACRISCR